MVKGNFEQRVNRFTRMALEWQDDVNRDIIKPNSYYQRKYHFGMTPKEFFKDIKTISIDRQWVISTMEKISQKKKQESVRYKKKKDQLQLELFNDKNLKIDIETNTHKKSLIEYDTNDLIKEVSKRGFIVFKQYGISND